MLNAANQPVWQWESAPFGDTAADPNPSGLGSFDYTLRFPGQQYDAETGQHYNYFRDYEASTGRYVQSDPIGLEGGIANFLYVASNPLRHVDVLGLCKGGDCDNEPKPLCDWLSDQPGLLNEARYLYGSDPQWQGIDPNKTPVFYRCKEDVDEIRWQPGESGGHHPHALALGGPRGQVLTPTNENRTCKNKCHVKATALQMRLIRAIRCKLCL